MTTAYKSKAELKAEQNASQDNQSQDASPQNLSIVDGVTKFYETRCEFYENVFLQADQQAAKDVMGKFLTYDKGNREAVGGAFFGNLATKRQALNFGLLPSLFLPSHVEAEVVEPEPAEIETLTARFDELVALEKNSEATDAQLTELDEVEAKLKALGVML
jgi:hypothetical protein